MGLQLPDYIKNAKAGGHAPLDLEIAGEGQKVVLSDGTPVAYDMPAAKPAVPDWSEIKLIRRYFFRSGFEVYPAWLYHPTEAPQLVKTAEEAGELGICFRKATADERMRYGKDDVWDWEPGCQWRPSPYPEIGGRKVLAIEHGKELVHSTPNPQVAQSRLIAEMVPAVAAAVAQVLKTDGPAAPANVDPKEWQEFLQFQAFKKSQEAVGVFAAADERAEQDELALIGAADNKLSPEQERTLWEEEAKRLNIKIDGRWSTERVRIEVEKAQKVA